MRAAPCREATGATRCRRSPGCCFASPCRPEPPSAPRPALRLPPIQQPIKLSTVARSCQASLFLLRQPRPRRAALSCNPRAPTLLFPRLLEITQIRRRLILVSRHQLAIGRVNNVSLIADLDPDVVLWAGLQQPYRARILLAHGLLDFGVRPRHGVIYHGDLVIERVAVRLVEIEPLLDDGLVVLVKWNA